MEEQEHFETSVLQRIIGKIGGLLALGFGSAGNEIIIQNMKNNYGINPMIPGKNIMGIYGFCNIRYFPEATEVL